MLNYESNRKLLPVLNKVSEKNQSCPDLTDQDLYYKKMNSDNSLESISIDDDNVFVDSKTDPESSTEFNYHSNVQMRQRKMNTVILDNQKTTKYVRQKYLFMTMRPKKKDPMPSDILKQSLKVKHSLSMHNLFKDVPKPKTDYPFDIYHTIHGQSSFSFKKQFSNDSIPLDRLKNRYLYGDSVNSSLSNSCNTLNTTSHPEVIYKCCCGGKNCQTVVPIHQYLERYFIKTVRIQI